VSAVTPGQLMMFDEVVLEGVGEFCHADRNPPDERAIAVEGTARSTRGDPARILEIAG
jgi:hypothetical protein